MMGKKLDYLAEGKLVLRHGQQFYHLHQSLKAYDEAKYITALAAEYHESGRVQTLSEGIVLAGAVITAYRSNEAGERAPQRARARLEQLEASQQIGQVQCNLRRA